MKHRYCIIMAGGIGSRFWPVSRTNRPKQFLDFFGTGHTFLQLTYERFRKIIPSENIFVVTNEQYKELVKQQIPEIDDDHVLSEPQRRNTAPCIAWGVYHIQAIDPEANIVVTPSDHLILKEDTFAECIEKGLHFAENFPALLTLGIKPNRPETGYGYIQIGDESNGDIKTVKTFTEKPSQELAEVFIESGEFFWNSGIFIWNVQTIIKAFKRYLPEVSARFESGIGKFNTPEEKAFIQENFPACQNISIDFGLMEKASNVFVLCADFGWADVGTWRSLYDISPKDKNGNAYREGKSLIYESNSNIIAVPDDKLVIIDGLKDYIVADSNDVLLICRKDEEERIRQIVNDVKARFGNEFI